MCWLHPTVLAAGVRSNGEVDSSPLDEQGVSPEAIALMRYVFSEAFDDMDVCAIVAGEHARAVGDEATLA